MIIGKNSDRERRRLNVRVAPFLQACEGAVGLMRVGVAGLLQPLLEQLLVFFKQ